MPQHSKRAPLIEHGLELVHRDGFGSSSVAAIAAAADAPKGSFYNHFASKDAFGVALLDRYFEDVRTALAATVGDQRQAPLPRLREYFVLLRELATTHGYARGCLIGNLSAEVTPDSAAMRAHLGWLMHEWTDAIAGTVGEAQAGGAVRSPASAHTLAALLLDGWQGALLRAKVERSPAPLDAFLDVLLPSLLQAHSA
jgi:TetR/AcrR family transcriptional regulator, transcriptional repressor for nem operon